MLLDIFVTDGLWAGEAAARLKVTGAAVDSRDCKKRECANNILIDAGAVGGSKELLLVLSRQTGGNEAGALGFHRGFVQLQQKFNLLVGRDIERVFSENTLPIRNDFGHGNQLDRVPLIGGIGAGNGNRLLSDAPHRASGNIMAGGKTPGPFDQHAHTAAEVLAARDVLDLLLARKDRFVPVAVDADVRISSAEFLSARKGQVS